MIPEKLTNLETFTQIPGQVISKIGQLAHFGLRKSCDAIGLGDGVSNILDKTPESTGIIDIDEPVAQNIHYLHDHEE